jgi:hypothetical protein
MAKLVVAMNHSLDGYVDHEAMAPSPALFRRWIGSAAAVLASSCLPRARRRPAKQKRNP